MSNIPLPMSTDNSMKTLYFPPPAQSPSVLVSVGMSYLSELDMAIPHESYSILEQTFTEVLDGKKTVFDAGRIFHSILGTTKPLDRIATILQTSDVPIPNFQVVPVSGPKMGYSNYGGCFENGYHQNAYRNKSCSNFYPQHGITIGSNSMIRKLTRSWTGYEDQRLLAALHRFGLDNWQLCANYVGNGRTRAQCSQRWVRGLDPSISRTRWSDEEESQLLKLVETYGTKSWTKIAHKIKTRSDVQCRYHYKLIKKMSNESQCSSSSENNVNLQNEEIQETVPDQKISISGSVPLLRINDPMPTIIRSFNPGLNSQMSSNSLLRNSNNDHVLLPSIDNILNISSPSHQLYDIPELNQTKNNMSLALSRSGNNSNNEFILPTMSKTLQNISEIPRVVENV
ncbi:Myb-like DNA-binding domain containing protein [Tritrichomonas foetus]|uniref:Myb-like DNA-binding domain containing protein n=1 Tax=Tritrichomonas foetus TaxID=1144522 RepID=A0A1J4K7Y5_9EUKA|nr:Myb-like DNA-binding domain containing protein [Tritrichomonas foetus]|eukprot:OHT07315.1 Myb-like DNA-binding domain containing protein [Tritrichomonas foetus]